MAYNASMTNQKFFVPTQHTGKVLALMQKSVYNFNFDSNGNITKIELYDDYIGYDDTSLFNSIAPYVQNGSFIQMIDEEGRQWRWVFNNGKCKQVQPKIVWP